MGQKNTISNLKSTLGWGARTNKYSVILNAKANKETNTFVNTLVKSASVPGRTFADIEVWVQGRLVTVAGDATFDGTWNLTFYDKEDHSLRKVFINWMEYIDSYSKHDRGAKQSTDYMTTATLNQLGGTQGDITASYTLFNVYPKSLSEITYSDENSGIVEFSVEFNFSYWEMNGTNSKKDPNTLKDIQNNFAFEIPSL